MTLAATTGGLVMLLSTAVAEAGVEYRSAPGRVAINVDSDTDEFTAVAALPGGATLAAGEDWIVRLRRDGSLDRSYGDSGVARIDGAGVSKLSVGEDRGVLVVTSAPDPPNGPERRTLPRVVRLTAEGRIDRGFGTNGRRELPSLKAAPGTAVAAAAPDGGVYVAGRVQGTRSAGVARITPAGTIDTSFGVAGVLQLPLQSVQRLEIADGNLLVLGWRPEHTVAVLYRYDLTGQPDTGFGEGRGYVDLVRMRREFDMAVDRRGRIWVLASRPATVAGVLRRLLPDGRSDTSFDPRFSPGLTRLLLTPRGATVVHANSNIPRVSVARFEDDGRLDHEASFPPKLGGGVAPHPQSRGEGRIGGGIFYAWNREATAQHRGGRIILAGGIEVDETSQGLTPALIAIRDGRALDRRFGRPTGAPDVSLESAKNRGGRAVAVRLRAETRGIARLTLRLGGRRIARRVLAFPRAGASSERVRMSLTPTGRRMLRDAGDHATATLHVIANDMAGNFRRVRFDVPL